MDRKIYIFHLSTDDLFLNIFYFKTIIANLINSFVEGLTIGASISRNLFFGLTTSIGCWCANIPQEFGMNLFSINLKYF